MADFLFCLLTFLWYNLINEILRRKEIYMKKVGFALLAMLVTVPAMAATAGLPDMKDTVCDLMAQFGSIFNVLRILAFVGAGFSIAGWAWKWIQEPDKFKVDDVKSKGVGLLVGFTVLFGIGAIISAFMSMAGDGGSFGCVVDMWKVQK